MAILQALLALISKSAGKILNSIFGWAVRGLFGRASPKEITFLSGLVAAAAAWPLLFVGLAAPKFAALMLAFVPIPSWVPAWVVRWVWLGLVIVVPLAMGITMAAKAPAHAKHVSVFKRLASGFPITIGLALAFLIMFVTVPASEVAHLAHKQIELAKNELRADLRAEATTVGGLGIAALAGLATINLLLVTAVFALAQSMSGWLAGLIVSGLTLVAGAVIALLAWNKRVRAPLARTRRTLNEDIQWAKERLV